LAFDAGGFVTLQPLGCAHPLMSDLKIAETCFPCKLL
jgi:hypothetical protein